MQILNPPVTFGNSKNAIVSKNVDLVTNCKQKGLFCLQIITVLIIKHLRISVKYFYVRLFFCAVCRCFKNKIEQKSQKNSFFLNFLPPCFFDGIFLNLHNSLKIKRVPNCKFDVFRYLTCKSMKIWKCHKIFYRARYTIE